MQISTKIVFRMLVKHSLLTQKHATATPATTLQRSMNTTTSATRIKYNLATYNKIYKLYQLEWNSTKFRGNGIQYHNNLGIS